MVSDLPVEIWTHIIRVATEWQPADAWYQWPPSCAWSHRPLDHPAVALSQTSKWLRAVAAPLLWRDLTVTGDCEEVLYRVKKLTICLHDPLVKNTIRTLDLDLGEHGYMGLLETSPECFEGPPCAPTYIDYLALMTQLGEALAGSALAELRFDAHSVHPSDGFIEAVGRGCPQLHHVEIGYGADAMPWEVRMDEVKINGPDPLHLLSQVRSASIGMGFFHDTEGIRQSDRFSLDLDSESNIPYFLHWLRGSRLGSSSSSGQGEENEDNNLVNLKTNAPFLYQYRDLIPAWARFNRIEEELEVGSEAEGGYFPRGECIGWAGSEQEMAKEIRFIRAAKALRPSLDRLLEERQSQSNEVTPTEVVGMIRTEEVFVPWRSTFFPRTEPGDVAYDESLVLAEEILYHWRKSEASRRADRDGPCQRWHTGWPKKVIL
ncbi:hypothetical protein OC845_000542 [Tilletia horrida]|nr:hypothetical protein OC845_000542 [Tilletia horrida]